MRETSTYTVTGMTRGHWVSSVSSSVTEIGPGDPRSRVRRCSPRDRFREHHQRRAIDDVAVGSAVEEAGCQLA